MRPKHPHAAESGVGKHITRESESAKECAAGKERVANAHSHKLAPEASKTSGAFFVFRNREAIPLLLWLFTLLVTLIDHHGC